MESTYKLVENAGANPIIPAGALQWILMTVGEERINSVFEELSQDMKHIKLLWSGFPPNS